MDHLQRVLNELTRSDVSAWVASLGFLQQTTNSCQGAGVWIGRRCCVAFSSEVSQLGNARQH